MNPSRDRGAGQRVEQIIRVGAFRRRRVNGGVGKAGIDQQSAAQRETWLVRPAFDLLRFGKRPPAVEPPERQFRMNLEHARGLSAVRAQIFIHLADFWRNVKQLLRNLARRIGVRERQPAGFAIIGGVNRRPCRHREHRRLTLPQQRAHRILRLPPAVTRALRQADGNVDRDNRRRLGRPHYVGKARRDLNAQVVPFRPNECDHPSAWAAIRARKPYVVIAHARSFIKLPFDACAERSRNR